MGDGLGELWKGGVALGGIAVDCSAVGGIVDPGGCGKKMTAIGSYVWNHPGDFFGSMIDYKDLSQGNYAKWAGHLAPSIALAVATAGAGGAIAKGGEAAGLAAEGADAAGEAGVAASGAAGEAATAAGEAGVARAAEGAGEGVGDAAAGAEKAAAAAGSGGAEASAGAASAGAEGCRGIGRAQPWCQWQTLRHRCPVRIWKHRPIQSRYQRPWRECGRLLGSP